MSQYRFSEWISEQLERKGWRPSDFADQAGIGRSAVSRWINEGYQPNIPNARAAADVLGVSLLEILVQSEQLSEEEATAYRPGREPERPNSRGNAAAFRSKVLAEVSDVELAAEVTRRLTSARRRRM
ncbi:helix-turn-helix domain-containing protein [Saccharopolyspora shandongensis]|uniref:helix-turn-helix domain-containing protein n=1 Tax=Saccharopolyspora shandongensis TaxID=418495 RepID=UPI0033E1DD84